MTACSRFVPSKRCWYDRCWYGLSLGIGAIQQLLAASVPAPMLTERYFTPGLFCGRLEVKLAFDKLTGEICATRYASAWFGC